jgi:hypothetical protein
VLQHVVDETLGEERLEKKQRKAENSFDDADSQA